MFTPLRLLAVALVTLSSAATARAERFCPPGSDCRDRNEPDDPIVDQGPLPIAEPDLVFQRAPCLGDQFNELVASALESDGSFAEAICANGETRVGTWISGANSETTARRRQWLTEQPALGSGENFAIFVSSSAIRRSANAAFAATPKRLNESGAPDPNGMVYLQGLQFSTTAPASIVTRITGTVTPPLSSVPFYLTLTDTLSTSRGAVTCASSSEFYADTSSIAWSAAVSAVFFPPLLGVFGPELAALGNASPSVAGVGCMIARSIPNTRMLPGGLRLDARYSRVNVRGGGVFSAGTHTIEFRIGRASVIGPVQVAAGSTPTFSVSTNDLRGPLSYTWTTSGAAIVGSASNPALEVLAPAQDQEFVVSVHIVDADGVSADATKTVRTRPDDADDDGLPPVCSKKPNLPQCRF